MQALAWSLLMVILTPKLPLPSCEALRAVHPEVVVSSTVKGGWSCRAAKTDSEPKPFLCLSKQNLFFWLGSCDLGIYADLYSDSRDYIFLLGKG